MVSMTYLQVLQDGCSSSQRVRIPLCRGPKPWHVGVVLVSPQYRSEPRIEHLTPMRHGESLIERQNQLHRGSA